jgi:hypothetical protein
MVIMALLPKAVDLETGERTTRTTPTEEAQRLRIATPSRLPEAVAGRAYLVALAAIGGQRSLRWSVEEPLPEWLRLDEASGQLSGVPPRETTAPLTLAIVVSDGQQTASRTAQLAVLPWTAPAATAAWLEQRLNVVRLRAWLEQGVGFLVLWLVHLLGMNLLANLERASLNEVVQSQGLAGGQLIVEKRFAVYRLLVRLMTLTAMGTLAAWLLLAHGARV